MAFAFFSSINFIILLGKLFVLLCVYLGEVVRYPKKRYFSLKQVRILYVRNLMLHTTEETLRDQFNLAAGFKSAVERVKKMKDYAFIHFTDRTLAANALAIMNGTSTSFHVF